MDTHSVDQTDQIGRVKLKLKILCITAEKLHELINYKHTTALLRMKLSGDRKWQDGELDNVETVLNERIDSIARFARSQRKYPCRAE